MKRNQTEKVYVFDTTLRDGEQAAGTRLDSHAKLEIARQLAQLNVDIIEAGFPVSSPEDFRSVELIAGEVDGPVICGLTRAVEEDIHVCGKALKKARKSRIHTGLGVSDIHIEGKFKDSKYGTTIEEKKETIVRMAVDAIRCARDYTNDIEFYAEDAGRAEVTFLLRILEAAIDAGATVVNIPDTTGYTVPEIWGNLIDTIRTSVPNIDKAVISVHCHDDLGMAVANTLVGVKNGARQIEGTLNGIGERAGNAALEEAVMAINTRRDYFGVHTDIRTQEFYRSSRLVADQLGFTVPRNKAVVGDNAFKHSSGIHVDGFLKKRETYEIMTPEDVGIPKSAVVLTARTGRHGLRHRLEELGYHLNEKEVERVYRRFLDVADKKREVFDGDLVAIVHDEVHPEKEMIILDYLHTTSGTGTIPTATVRLKVGEETREGAECGDGPVDATYKAIEKLSGMEVQLASYDIRAVTAGTEAMGEVTVRLARNGVVVIGRGASTDVIEASGKAFIDGLNRLLSITSEGD